MSYMSRLAWVSLGMWLLGLTPALAQEKPPEEPWTGKLANGQVITKADLDHILKEHSMRLVSDIKEKKRANLTNKTNLSKANLRKVFLSEEANLSEAFLSKTDLSEALLLGSNLSGADLSEANLSKAVIGANLSKANLSKANLSGANLFLSNLSEANLSMADLSGADLSMANLKRARFEPKPGSLPGITGLLYIKNLDSLIFKGTSSYGLMELREIFKKAGMRDQERQLTYALNHNHRVNAWEEIRNIKWAKRKGIKIDWISREIGRLENNFQLVFFEWTCDYGMTPSRPLLLMFLGLFVFTLPYLLALRSWNPRTGIWLLLLPDRVLDRQIKDRPAKLTFRTPFRPLPAKGRARLWARCHKAWRALRLAFYFSLLSAFNLGWRELNVGTWITRIQKREYTLRGTGWVRMLSGIQALLSVYLLALWVLTYFGRPFE